MNWYEEWFSNKFYLELYQHRDEEDARWIINLLQRTLNVSTRSKVLDIACGSGRHSLELARRGFEVTGFDLSDYLISEAKRNLAASREKNLKLRFLKKDMRYFNFRNSFDIALNIFTSFGYFENDIENYRVIDNVSKSLKKNGYFVFDFLNKVYLEKNLEPYSKNNYGNVTVVQKRKLINGFVKKDIFIKKGNSEKHFREVLKLYSAGEFFKMFETFNLKKLKVFGDYFGNKFDESKSQRLVIFAKKI